MLFHKLSIAAWTQLSFIVLRTSILLTISLSLCAQSSTDPVSDALHLLLANFDERLGSTSPSRLLDVHQSSTTSILAGQAWAHFDQKRARRELLSIFAGQWENGLIPSVRYAHGYAKEYLGGGIIPGPGGWGGKPAEAAGGFNTSALAALPLHSEAALRIFDMSSKDAEARLWLQEIFPSLYRYHEYLHRHRQDPLTGLVYLYHPWETELPSDSVIWSALLSETSEQALNESWSPPVVPDDVSNVSGFPSHDVFEAELYLVECAARVDREDTAVQQNCPFLLQDVQFNAVLARSDVALLEMAGILEATRSSWASKVYTSEQYERLKRWAARAESGSSMSHLWSSSDDAFLSRYISTINSESHWVRPSTSAGFSAMLAPGLPSSRSNSAVRLLLSQNTMSFRCGNHPIPETECGDIGGRHEGFPLQGVNPEGEFGGKRRSKVELPHTTVKYGTGNSLSLRSGNAEDDRSRESWSPRILLEEDEVSGASSALSNTPTQSYIDVTRAEAVQSGRVWVLHNHLAQHGFDRQGFPGISGWLANATLSMIAADYSEYRNASGDVHNGQVQTLWENFSLRLDGDNVEGYEGAGGHAENEATFCRGFDSVSGAPVSDAEGNVSSASAAMTVLLLLGEGPEGGNEFPPITHATLFVLMTVELVFSFGVGVSCFVLSINLIRKLREDDAVGTSRWRGFTSRGDGAPCSRVNLGKGSQGAPAPGPYDESDKRRSKKGRSTRLPQINRGIGSLLTRNPHSRAELYPYESDEEQSDGETAAGSPNADEWVGLGEHHRVVSQRDEGETNATQLLLGERTIESAGLQRVPTQEQQAVYRAASVMETLPMSRDHDENTRSPHGNLQGQRQLLDVGPSSPQSGGRLNGRGSVGAEGGGALDLLRPFYSYLKFW